MAQRGTYVVLEDGRSQVFAGEPILDTKEGVLIIAYEDGTSRVFNWDFVIEYYFLTEEEFGRFQRED